MRISLGDDSWRLPAGTEIQEEHPEPPSAIQYWWVKGPKGEVLGKFKAQFSDEELALMFQ